MDQSPPLRLPAQLDSAAHRVRTAAREAAEQTVGSLGLAALSTHGVLQRDALLGAQYELNRKLALFGMAFNEALDTDIARQVGALTPAPDHPGRRCPSPDELVATWDTLSLRHVRFVLWEFSGTRPAMLNTLILGAGFGGIGAAIAPPGSMATTRCSKPASARAPSFEVALCTPIG